MMRARPNRRQHVRQHVLQIVPALNSGGVERGTIELASYLQTKDIKSSIVSSGGALCEQLTVLNTAHYQLSVHSKNPFKIIANGFRLARLIKDEKVTLLHVRSRAPAWSTLLASRLTGTPYLATFHGLYGHKQALKRFYNSAMLRGKYIIAVSEFIAEHIRQTYPQRLITTKLEVINRGVDCAYFMPAQSSNATLSPAPALAPALSTSNTGSFDNIDSTDGTDSTDKPQLSLLLPGRFTRLKGHAFVLSAIEQVTRCHLTLTMVGAINDKDSYVDALKLQARRSGHQVNFITEHQDLRPLYAQSDAVISASTKPESFGRTVIEAQAMQCMVIAPKQGANQSIVCPELQLGLFKPKDELSLAQAIEKIASLSCSERARMTMSARIFVEENFQLQQMTQKTLELYQQLWQDDRSYTSN